MNKCAKHNIKYGTMIDEQGQLYCCPFSTNKISFTMDAYVSILTTSQKWMHVDTYVVQI